MTEMMHKAKWESIKVEQLAANARNALAMGPFGSRITKDNFVDAGVPVIRGTNLSRGRFDHRELVFITENKANELAASNAFVDDLVFTHRGTLGQVGIIPRGYYPRYVISQSQMKLTCDQTKVVPMFLYYYFRSELGLHELLSHIGGSGVPAISSPLTTLRNAVINLPPLLTQHKIASILSAYDDLIENNTRRITILEEMAQSLYREWFVHFRFPGHEKKSMVESVLGMIPEGWEVVKLGDIAQEVRRSVNPESIDPETPYFGLEHLPRKSIALADWGTAKEVQSTKLAFKKGEILFGKIRPYFHKVGVAPVEGVCSSDTIVIVPRTEKYFAVVLSCVSSEDFVNFATRTSQGTKMPRANWEVLVKYPVALPPQAILYQFEEFVKDIVLQIQNMIFRNRHLRQTRDLLLPKLISGEVDVEGLDICIEGERNDRSISEAVCRESGRL